MIWLTWRQLRGAVLMMGACLAVLAVALGATGNVIADDYSSGMAACRSGGGDCSGFVQNFFNSHHGPFLMVTAVALILPALIGLFWGAPLLAREIEGGTLRLVWNQGVTRNRWLATKLGITGLLALLAAGAGTLAVSWWAEPLDKTAARDYPRMAPLLFAGRGIVPIGYAAFAFVLGVTVGMLMRRTVPAMAVMLAVFVAVQVAMPLLVRPHLIPPTHSTQKVTFADLEGIQRSSTGDISIRLHPQAPKGGWMLSGRTVDTNGAGVTDIDLGTQAGEACPMQPGGPGAGAECLIAQVNAQGYRTSITYQPASRFWAMQWAETGIYAGLTAGLTAFCLWWVRRRLV
jgi:hypothetical protein